jgi:hypothetical protein
MDLTRLIRAEWDRLAAVILVVVAIVILLAGWFGVSGTPYPAEQIPYIVSSGIGSVLVLGIAATLWVSADLRDEWRKLDSIDEALRDLKGTALVNEVVVTNGVDHRREPAMAAGSARGRRARPLRASDTLEDISE